MSFAILKGTNIIRYVKMILPHGIQRTVSCTTTLLVDWLCGRISRKSYSNDNVPKHSSDRNSKNGHFNFAVFIYTHIVYNKIEFSLRIDLEAIKYVNKYTENTHFENFVEKSYIKKSRFCWFYHRVNRQIIKSHQLIFYSFLRSLLWRCSYNMIKSNEWTSVCGIYNRYENKIIFFLIKHRNNFIIASIFAHWRQAMLRALKQWKKGLNNCSEVIVSQQISKKVRYFLEALISNHFHFYWDLPFFSSFKQQFWSFV